MNRPTILLDVDCTLADFVGGLAAAHGVPGGAAALYREQPRGTYGYTAALGRALGRGSCRDCGGLGHQRQECGRCRGSRLDFTAADFWSPLNRAGADFWAGLAPLPWCDELLALVRGLTDDYYFVTSTSRCPGCVPGKQAWLARLLGVDWTDRLIPTKHKHLLARPGAVLVDDADANCDRFEKDSRTRARTGGVAIPLPSHHNRLHHRADDPLLYVRTQLELLK